MDRIEEPMAIAIDGTAASGKSTVAKMLAEHLGCAYLDTGKLYRALALQFLERWSEDPHSWSADPVALQQQLTAVVLELRAQDVGECRIVLQGEDVNEQLAELRVERATPYAARLPEVREYLLDVQRDLAHKNTVIMAGRDIGTVVLPNATLKVFIEADLQERARRRLSQHKSEYSSQEFEHAAQELAARDHKDASREHAPMSCAEDALRLNSTATSPQDLVATILRALKLPSESQAS